jgi:hypothetical protein
MAERYSTRPSAFLAIDPVKERHLALSADYTAFVTGATFRKEEHDRLMADSGHPTPLTAEEIQVQMASQSKAFEEMEVKSGPRAG